MFAFFFFRATPMVYGSFQARSPIRAAASGLHHSSQQCQVLNPLSRARNGTHILMDTSWVHNLLGHNGNSRSLLFNNIAPYGLSSLLFFHISTGLTIDSIWGWPCPRLTHWILSFFFFFLWLCFLLSRSHGVWGGAGGGG